MRHAAGWLTPPTRTGASAPGSTSCRTVRFTRSGSDDALEIVACDPAGRVREDSLSADALGRQALGCGARHGPRVPLGHRSNAAVGQVAVDRPWLQRLARAATRSTLAVR